MADQVELTTKLEALLPVLKEKETQGLILPSFERAKSLLEWSKTGRGWTEKQQLLVGRIILRAERKHKKGGNISVNNTVVQKVDVDAVAEQVLAKIAGRHGIDVGAVADVVLKKIEERVPRKVEIQVKDTSGAVKKLKDQPRHNKFEHLLRAASTRLSNGHAPGIFLQGEASSGKTTGAHQLAEALGLNWHFNGAISFPHEMLGFIDGAGKYHRTPFREAYEKGGVYTFDEVDRCDPVALLAVNPHLANGVATFPDKQVKRHKDCIIVCTANTWGLGADANYSGATKLDAAFLSRFPVRINWDIDPALEQAIVPDAEWLTMIRAARARARAVGLKVLIDTRAALAGVALLQAGYSRQEAADMTYLANLKPEQRKQVTGGY
jgi:cobaltochelatase CobS